MELLDVFRILRRRWLPAVIVATVVAGLFALFPTTMMPLPPSQAVTEVTLRLELNNTDAATVKAHQARLDEAATADATLVEARNLANVTPEYMKTGAKLTWRGPTTFDVTFTGPEREPTLALADRYVEEVSRLDGRIIPQATVTASSRRDVVANQRVLPQDQSLGRKALSVPLGVVAGVILGLATAFGCNAADRRLRGRQDLPLTGLLDSQVLGEGDANALAGRVKRRTDGPVSVTALGADAAPLTAALHEAGVSVADGAPSVIVVAKTAGVLKSEVAATIAGARDLVAVGVWS